MRHRAKFLSDRSIRCSDMAILLLFSKPYIRHFGLLKIRGFVGSLINLAGITVERYLKVVHAVWKQKNLRNWMVHSAVAFAWFGGIAVAEGATVPTLNVANGVCYTLPLWKSRPAQMAYGIWFFLSFYVIILSIFVFCYGRILVIIRRQSRVMATHGAPGSSGAQTTQLNRIQLKIIKTIVG